MTLPTTNRGNVEESYLPTNEDIGKVIETATEEESAAYAVDSFRDVIEKGGKTLQNAAQGMLNTLIINRDLKAGNQVDTDDCWRKGMVPMRTKSLDAETRALSQALEKDMANHKLSDLKVDFAVSGAGELKRAFTSNDNPLNETADNLLNDLLLLFLKGKGINVEVRDQGSFLRDTQGKLVDPEQARAVIADPDSGFHAHLQQHGVNTSIKAHPFPGEAPVGRRAPAPAAAAPVSTHEGEKAPTPS